MRYMILNLQNGIITPIMPFMYDGEITAEGIDKASRAFWYCKNTS